VVHSLALSFPTGIAMAGFLCAQTAVIKLTEEGPVRLAALGRLTSAYTIGGVLGPYIGGQLGSSGNYTLGAQSACAGSILAILLVFLLPSHLDAEDKEEDEEEDDDDKEDKEKEEPWSRRVMIVLSLVWLFLFVKIVTSIANSMARSAQPVILKRLGIKEDGMGAVMSFQFAFGGVRVFSPDFILRDKGQVLVVAHH